jgi:hypothetical protein
MEEEKQTIETKIPWFNGIKCGWKHRLGNVLSALVHVVENTIIILSLGFLYPNFSWKWMMWKLFDSKFFNENNKTDSNEEQN